ncbi:hypothetical protein [Adhaeretor mobilis]|uniref:Uncharacterized protein n=1 Tax=Adhaeretor mobilis TaxID=1930276 RepID=A0A517N362_9BACT|nr:hypothetical protein [Adhaeretor mobilis]QDT01577.1 hypothetical protein HG15A2_49240 [Adhaeretor mobilis]
MLVAYFHAAVGVVAHVRSLAIGASLAMAVTAWGQTQPPPSAPTYQGSAPAENANVYGGGGWGGGYHSSTAAGSALQGMSSAISAQGQKNLNDSLAARNLTAAASASIDNHTKYVEAQRWRMDSDKQRQQQEVAERQAKARVFNAKRAPHPLTPQQYDQTTGTVGWPMLCRDASYKSYQEKIDELLVKRAKYGSLQMEEFMAVEEQIKEWVAAITSDKNKYPLPAVKQALSFLHSLHLSLNEQFG